MCRELVIHVLQCGYFPKEKYFIDDYDELNSLSDKALTMSDVAYAVLIHRLNHRILEDANKGYVHPCFLDKFARVETMRERERNSRHIADETSRKRISTRLNFHISSDISQGP